MPAVAPIRSQRPLLAVVVRIVVAAVLVVVAADALVRLDEGRLPEPVTWYHPSAQVKVEQMADLQAAGERRPIVIAGTSQMAMGVDPAVLSDALPSRPGVYNAAVLAGYPVVTRRFVPEEVVPRLHPDVVVLGVSHLDLHVGPEPPYDDSPATSRSWWASAERWLADRSALVRHRALLRDPGSWPTVVQGTAGGEIELYRNEAIGADGVWRFPRTGRCRDAAKGGADVDERLAVERAVVDPDAPMPPLDPQRIADVWATVERLEASGVSVVVAFAPLPDCQFETLANRERFEQVRVDLAAGARARGATWIDLTDEMTADELYYDRGHLNEDGSRRYSALLADALVASGVVGAGS